MDSLSPFQVPRRSGIAVCAAAGMPASTANANMHPSFDMVGLLQVTGLFNHVIGDEQEVAADRQTQLSRGFEVDDQLEFGRLLYRQLRGLGSLEDFICIYRGLPGKIG